MKINNKRIRLKRFVRSIFYCERSAAILLALALVLSLGIVALPMAGMAEAQAPGEVLLYPVSTEGRPNLVGTITADGESVYFNIRAVGQADDGDAANPSKYYSQTNFDNEYFTISANGKLLKYNMFSGNTTPYWGTSWSDAANPLPDGVTFSQTQDGDGFVYAVSMSYAVLGVSHGDSFPVQIKARDFNDDYVQSYDGYEGYDGEYSHYNGLWITDTGVFNTYSTPSDVWVDDGWATLNLGDPADGHTFGYDAFAIIQDGVNAVSIGGTVHVAAGTYTPSSTIIIKKDNLTLNGPQANVDPRPSYGSTRTAGSALEAVIDGGGTLSNIILIEANNVVINGFEVKSGTGDMIKQDSSHIGTVVKYNIIHDGLGDEGVQLKKCTNGVLEYNYVFEIADPGDGLNIADSSSYGTIQYNEVCGIHGENAAIYIYGSEHMEIIGNLVRNSGTGGNDGIKVGAKGTGDTTKKDVLVKDNIIHDITQDGISVYMSDVTVEGNEIYNCHSENGAIYLAYAISNIDIHDNDIYNNTLETTKRLTSAGILLENRVNATLVTVYNNNIYNNTPYGITNEAIALLDATCNWWGDASGPYHSTNPGGTGDKVSDNVNYNPWYIDEGKTTLSNAIATLSDFTVDGTTITGFDSSTLTYNKVLPYGTTEVPTVGATTTDSNASKVITQAANFTGTEVERTATVVVTAEDGTTTKTYKVIFGSVNVTISKNGPTTANQGNNITYTITYKNVGTFSATNVVITENYPSEVEYRSATPAPSEGNNIWDIGDLASDAEGTIKVTVHIK